MILDQFVLFGRGNRIRAALLPGERRPESFVYRNAVYQRAGSFGHFNQLLTQNGTLVGFVLEHAGPLEVVLPQTEFVSKTEKTKWDGYALTALLSQDDPSSLDYDGVAWVGPTVYLLDRSDLIITLDDLRGFDGPEKDCSRFSHKLGFELDIEDTPKPNYS
ncbi:MAG TPA: hypothetical protein VK633_10540 [Verrucomicrobiae bacterium]|nr:hypothetical protein [Verrucomicrobiae bacterium]